jgi:hypothetical protein
MPRRSCSPITVRERTSGLDKLAEEVARDFSGHLIVGEDLTEIDL